MTSFIRSRLRRAADDAERGWPTYLFGGRVRTSTVVLVLAFLAVWWVYNDHQQSTKFPNKTNQSPSAQVVPPGFIPDPNYTWVPRSRVQAPPKTVTVTPTRPTTTTNSPPPIVLPPPLGPPAPTTAPPPPGALPPLPGLP